MHLHKMSTLGRNLLTHSLRCTVAFFVLYEYLTFALFCLAVEIANMVSYLGCTYGGYCCTAHVQHMAHFISGKRATKSSILANSSCWRGRGYGGIIPPRPVHKLGPLCLTSFYLPPYCPVRLIVTESQCFLLERRWQTCCMDQVSDVLWNGASDTLSHAQAGHSALDERMFLHPSSISGS